MVHGVINHGERVSDRVGMLAALLFDHAWPATLRHLVVAGVTADLPAAREAWARTEGGTPLTEQEIQDLLDRLKVLLTLSTTWHGQSGEKGAAS